MSTLSGQWSTYSEVEAESMFLQEGQERGIAHVCAWTSREQPIGWWSLKVISSCEAITMEVHSDVDAGILKKENDLKWHLSELVLLLNRAMASLKRAIVFLLLNVLQK